MTCYLRFDDLWNKQKFAQYHLHLKQTLHVLDGFDVEMNEWAFTLGVESAADEGGLTHPTASIFEADGA